MVGLDLVGDSLECFSERGGAEAGNRSLIAADCLSARNFWKGRSRVREYQMRSCIRSLWIRCLELFVEEKQPPL